MYGEHLDAAAIDAMMRDIASWYAVWQSVERPKQKAAQLGITPQHLLRLARRAYVHKRTKYELSKLLKFVSRETFIDEHKCVKTPKEINP